MILVNRKAVASFGSRRVVASAFDAATTGRRGRTWGTSDWGPNAALLGSASTIRARARDAVRNSLWAGNANESFAANVVGTGIKPRSAVQDKEIRDRIHALWAEWIEYADADETCDFYGQQALVARAVHASGELFARVRYRRPEDGLPVAMQVQLLESDMVAYDVNEPVPGGGRIIGGIEFDAIGRRVAYHMHANHPGDALYGSGSTERRRVPADQVIHVFKPLRPGQQRGLPHVVRALLKLHELGKYDEAEVIRKKIAAMLAGFIIRDGSGSTMFGEDEAELDEAGDPLIPWEPGTLNVLQPGEDIKFSEPADVGGSYKDFMRLQCQALARGMDVTYEQMSGDLTGANYSSIRAGLVESRRCQEPIQRMIVFQFCRKVWNAWLDQAVLEGALTIPGYAERRREFQRVTWIRPAWEWVDPLKDTQATLAAIDGLIMSRSEAIAQRGRDPNEVDAEIAADNERAATLGIPGAKTAQTLVVNEGMAA